MGMAFVIISGNIDLSVGSVVGVTGALAASLQVKVLPTILSGIENDFFITLYTIIIVLLLDSGMVYGLLMEKFLLLLLQ